MSGSTNSPPQLVDGFFRREYGRAVGGLVRRFGASQLEHIEDCVQTAMQRALETWGRRGIPANPSAWIRATAKNLLLDAAKHAKVVAQHTGAQHTGAQHTGAQHTGAQHTGAQHTGALAPSEASAPEARFASELGDDTLRMLFVCCDPLLARRTQLALALKIVCGFGIREIAAALMQDEQAIRKRITRGRNELREIAIESQPNPEESLSAVHQVLYVMFNKGYSPGSGETPLETSLCLEAIRLGQVLAEHPKGDVPASWALLALMRLHQSRAAARFTADGTMRLLDEQDRARWDREQISLALGNLARSANGSVFTRFHAEAGIQVEHCLAPSYGETNWEEIVRLYELHESQIASPTHTLNRAIALGEWKGPEAGLALLESMTPPAWLARWYLWDATLGELHRRASNLPQAAHHLERALHGAPSAEERRRIAERLASVVRAGDVAGDV